MHYVEVARSQASACHEGHRHGGYFFPSANFLENPAELESLFAGGELFPPGREEGGHKGALERLCGIPGHLAGVEALLEEGIGRNVTYAAESIAGVAGRLRSVAARAAEETGFYVPFQNISKEVVANQEKKEAIQERALGCIAQVQEAYSSLADFLEGKYSEHVRPEIGLSSLPGGDGMYLAILKFYTEIEGVMPEQVHQVGLDQVEELKEKVLAVGRELGLEGDPLTVAQVFAHARALPDQTFQSKEEMLRFAKDLFEKNINPKLVAVLPEEYFGEGDREVRVKPSDSFGLPLFYNAGSLDGERPGTFFINMGDITAFKKFEIPTIAMHEGNPGHNFQMGVFNARHGFPKFMAFWASAGYATAPSRFPLMSAHSEGWGLYSEDLGVELGVFDTPLTLLGYYSGKLLRATRLVVDTGIHAFGWPKERAVKYLTDHTALSRGRAEGEVNRYITWPGQATTYAMGGREINRARAGLQEELGESFDLKVFHRNVLACLGPMGDRFTRCLKLQYELQEEE